jgi:nucleotide-binding universal stress UspA family protein
MSPIKHILAPIDWSEPSNRAFQFAVSLARQHDADLTIIYVMPVPVAMYGPASDVYLDHLREELRCMKPVDGSCRVNCLLVEGNAATAILKAAKDNHCDLIVMGSHGRTGLERFVLGSVAEQVVRKAPCAVLIVGAKASPGVAAEAC